MATRCDRRWYGRGVKRYYIRYTEEWERAPMSFWVHPAMDGRRRYRAPASEPPLPKPVPGKGYPRYYVELDDFVFEFASLAEIDTRIATLSRKHLPSTDRETSERGTGPGSHWLNKLPGRTRSWRFRSRAIKYLREARKAFETAQ